MTEPKNNVPSVVVDVVSWTTGDSEIASVTWQLLADALCGAADPHHAHNRIGTVAPVAPRGAWKLEDAGAS